MSVSTEAAILILDEAREFSFIKTVPGERGEITISLHDEMRELIKKHVLDEIDRDQSLRREYSAAAVLGWEEKCNKLSELLQGESRDRAEQQKLSKEN